MTPTQDLDRKAIAEFIQSTDREHGYAVGFAIDSKIRELIGESVPNWPTLKAVASGTDYWKRRSKVRDAMKVAKAMFAIGIQTPGGSKRGWMTTIGMAGEFLEFQRETFFNSIELSEGRARRESAEQELEALKDHLYSPF